MLHKNRVPGNTLVITIVVALVLAILSTSVIMLGYYSRQHQIAASIEQRLSLNLESATNLVLENREPALDAVIDTFDLFDKQQDSVVIKKGSWGIFEVACITAFSNQFSKKQGFISGSGLPDYMDGCLYLADHKRPLSVSGHTILTGDVYISKGGIRPIYIDQRGFSRPNLVNGDIKTSNDSLPALHALLIDHLNKLKDDTMGVSFKWQAGDSVVQSFADSTLTVYAKGVCQLSGISIRGHVHIKSDSIIEADAATRLEDVVLSAPVIKFKTGFKGTVQGIAADSIIVEPGCEFDYPSALVLLKKAGLKMQNVLRIEEGCKFTGIIIARCESDDIARCRVELQKNTLLNGIAYVMGYCSLAGRVNGTVLSDYFLYQQQSMLFENTLVDVELNRGQLSPWFMGSLIFQKPEAMQIIKWVK